MQYLSLFKDVLRTSAFRLSAQAFFISLMIKSTVLRSSVLILSRLIGHTKPVAGLRKNTKHYLSSTVTQR